MPADSTLDKLNAMIVSSSILIFSNGLKVSLVIELNVPVKPFIPSYSQLP